MVRNSTLGVALLEALERGYTIDKAGIVRNPKGRILKGTTNDKGYTRYSIRIDGVKLGFNGHQMQAYMKFGEEVFNNKCVRHLNDIRTDNSFDNIEIGDFKENTLDMLANGGVVGDCKKATSVRRKLSDEQCVEVFLMLQEGKTQKIIREKFGLSKSTLSTIINKADYYKEAIKHLI